MKEKKLHMIGNAHIDPVWLWQWQEGFQEIKATFRSALDRMNEYPDFIFTGSSAAFYEWIEQNEPAMFEQIRQRVQEGRWEIVGGWWIQPDCNIPSGESFARQALYAQRYFKAKFGVTAQAGYNPDSFGHAGMLPQILKKSGMDYYVFMRPGPHEKGLPGRLFWWESDDGTRVLTFRIPFEYLSGPEEIRSHLVNCMGELKEPFDELMCFYGVGNHGGGPTKANLEAIKRWNADPDFPTLAISSPNRYFRAMEQRTDLPIPVVHDDLQFHAVGCYSVHSGIKRWNRQGENMLLTAEKFAAFAERTTGQPYPLAELTQAWKGILFNQFHDIMGGTSLEEAYDDARDLHGEAMAIGARSLNHAIQSISWRIKIDQVDGMRPIVVFNPHAWPAKVSVEFEGGKLEDTYVLVDDKGKQVAWQAVRSHATVTGWRRRLSFVAELPAMGYRTYRLLTKEAPARQEFAGLVAEEYALENDRLRLEVDPATGFIKLFDKVSQFPVIPGDGARPTVIEDHSDTWSHGITQFDKKIGVFTVKSVRLVEQGPVKAVIRVESEYGRSTIVQDFTMYRELNRIDVNVNVDWHEHHKMLKLRFPTELHFPRATYEASYGHIQRPVNGDEEPGQNWIDLTGIIRANNSTYGLSLLNDGKYSFSVKEREMSLTVLRSPIYAHHDPYVPEADKLYDYMDQGIQRFTYTLLPHQGGWEDGETVRRAAELNARPVAIVETYHDGPLPQSGSFLAVDKANIVVSAVKRAEEGEDLIVRAYETNGVATTATITLPGTGRSFTVDFGKCDIRTFRVPRDESAPITECNLIEW